MAKKEEKKEIEQTAEESEKVGEKEKDLDKQEAPKIEKPKKSKASKVKTKKSKIRSKKYQTAISDFDKNNKYPLEEAVEIVKKTSYSKFDGTITLDIRLGKSKSDESIRGTVKLPHGIDKKLRIAIASEDLIEKIKKGEIDFDILLATPQEMPRLAQVAKILGPKGLMPNPKDGTVVEDPQKAKQEMAEMARYRADAFRNVHITVGKVSWDSKEIIENIQVVLKALIRFKKDTIAISATMGPGVKIEV